MAKAKQIITCGNPLTFGKHKGKTPETIISEGNEAYLAWLYKNNINPFSPEVEKFIKDWAVLNPNKWEKVKVKVDEPQQVDTTVEPVEMDEDKIFMRFAGVSKERQAMWGSW